MHVVQSAEPALPLRSDTMLGVCEAIGQDFGFNPNWLRLALGSLVLWNPWGAFSIYLGLGAIVGLTRLVAPQRLVQVVDGNATESDAPKAASEDLKLAA